MKPAVRTIIDRLLSPGTAAWLLAVLGVYTLAGTLLISGDVTGLSWWFTWPSGILMAAVGLQSVAASLYAKRSMSFFLVAAHLGLAVMIWGALLSSVTGREAVLGLAQGAGSSEAFDPQGWDLVISQGQDLPPVHFEVENLLPGQVLENRELRVTIDSIQYASNGLPVVELSFLNSVENRGTSETIRLEAGIRQAGAAGVEGLPAPSGLHGALVELQPRPVAIGMLLELLNFDIVYHEGTREPADFVSRVRVTPLDPVSRLPAGAATTAEISMNQPLRVFGYVLYQTSWEDLGDGNLASVLQVHLRPFESLPYAGGIILGVSLALYPFAGRLRTKMSRSKRFLATKDDSQAKTISAFRRSAPLLAMAGAVVAGGLLVAILGALPAESFDGRGFVEQAESIPFIESGGRVQPFSTWFDRIVHYLGFETAFDPDADNRGYAADKELLSRLLTNDPRRILEEPFLVVDATLVDPSASAGLFVRIPPYYILERWQGLSSRMNPETSERLGVLTDLASIGDAWTPVPFLSPPSFLLSEDSAGDEPVLQQSQVSFAVAAKLLRTAALSGTIGRLLTTDAETRSALFDYLNTMHSFAERYDDHPLRIVSPSDREGTWTSPIRTFWKALPVPDPRNASDSEIVAFLQDVTHTAEFLKGTTWQAAAADIHETAISWASEPDGFRTRIETWYRAIPWTIVFLFCVSLVCIAGISSALVGRSLLPLTTVQRISNIGRAAVSGALFLAAIAVCAMIWFRIGITMRPPVTNLESSLLFVSGGLALAALAAHVSKQRFSLVAGLIVAASCALRGQGLSAGITDEFAPVIAVLNSPVWLSIHVVVIATGYAVLLAAAVLAHVQAGIFLRNRSDPDDRLLRILMVSGLATVGMGTVLGGYWADQSWGRFWGWDPKENGALIVVLWVAIALHLRAGGRVGNKDFCLMSAWTLSPLIFSWFGINFIGKGLHAYGFSEGPIVALILAVAVETVAFIICRILVKRQTVARLSNYKRSGALRGTIISHEASGSRSTTLWLKVPDMSPGLAGGSSIIIHARSGTRLLRRAYSVTDRKEDMIRLTIRPTGHYTQSGLIVKKPVGSEVLVQGPFGSGAEVAIDNLKKDGVVRFVCFGIGISYIVGILSELKKRNLASMQKARAEVYYADGKPEEFCHLSELQDVCDELNFRLSLFPHPQRIDLGNIGVSEIERNFWVVCGPPAALATIDRSVPGLGDAKTALFETYTERSFDAPPGLTRRRLLIEPSRNIAEVSPGETLLDAMEADPLVRDSLPAEVFGGCRVGRCRNCSAQLISGEVLHASGVSAGEGEVLLCSAWPLSDCSIRR